MRKETNSPKERAKDKKYKYLACIWCGGDLAKEALEARYCENCKGLYKEF